MFCFRALSRKNEFEHSHPQSHSAYFATEQWQPETKRNKGLWRREWNLKKTLSWKLDKFTLFTDFLVGRHSKNLNKHVALIFFCSSWQFKQEKYIFWKASFSQNKNIVLNPPWGVERILYRYAILDFVSGLHNRVEFPLSSHGKVFYCLGPVRKTAKNRVYRLQKWSLKML